jgi:hypothetical protein
VARSSGWSVTRERIEEILYHLSFSEERVDNPALVDNYFTMKEKGLPLVEQPDDFLRKSLSCTVSGNWFKHLAKLVESLLYINQFR